ncbi:MAG: TolC family protein [Deferrisomatales bacterium]
MGAAPGRESGRRPARGTRPGAGIAAGGPLLRVLTLVLAAAPALAGYRDATERIEAYEPPALYRFYAAPAAEAPAPLPPSDDDFKAQVSRVLAAGAAWQAALEEPGEDGRFLRPDPERLARLGPAAADPSRAAQVLAGPIDLADLETLAVLRSPRVLAAESSFRAALEAYGQVANLDELLRRYSAFTEGLMTGVGGMAGAPPAARFPFPGVLALKGQIAGQEAALARERLEEARAAAVTEARTAWWELRYVDGARAVTASMLDLLKHLDGAAAARYQAGDANFQDVVRVRIAIETTREELATVGEERRNVEARLRAALELPPATPVGATAPREPARQAPPADALLRLALEHRQELRAMRAEVGVMERMIEMAETMILPPYTLNLSLFEDRAIAQVGTMPMEATFPTAVAAAEGAGLPRMPWFGANDAYLRETRQRLEAARRELRGAEADTGLMVREAWFRQDRARREADLYGSRVAELSQLALEAATRGYQAGAVAFADVIESYREWLDAMLLAERKRADLGIARAELERAVGTAELGQ